MARISDLKHASRLGFETQINVGERPFSVS